MLYAFIFEHRGVYMPGFSVVMARNADDARNNLATLLHSSGLQPTIAQARIVAASADIKWSMHQPISAVIWDGDY